VFEYTDRINQLKEKELIVKRNQLM
jgi:hypothetical protein